MRVVDPSTSPEFIGVYSPTAGCGKTQLVTALPWGPKWGQKAIYVPIDPRSEGLRSVLPENREHLIVVKPEPKTAIVQAGAAQLGASSPKLVMDLNEELVEIFSHDWRAEYPDVGTIICDTFTVGAENILMAVASQSAYSNNPITYGKGIAKITIPSMGDYGATQAIVKRWLQFLEAQPLNVIVVFHGDWVEPESGVGGVISGGPTTVGKAGIRDMARKFDNLFFVNVQDQAVPAAPGQPPKRSTRYTVHTTKTGIWEAKLRIGSSTNPMPMTDITGDPKKFWTAFDTATGGS